MSDILIIGGGVIGLTSAYFFAKSGLKVEVVDRGDLGRESSWAGAGILPAVSDQPSEDPIEQLRALSVPRFPAFSSELKDLTGIDNGFQHCGGLDFLEGRTDLDLQAWRKGRDFPILEESDVLRLEPALSPGFGRALDMQGLTQLRNPRHVRALIAACESLDVQFRRDCPVRDWEMNGPNAVAALTDQGRLTAKHFLLATGTWADELLSRLGFHPGVHPIRGQIALLRGEKQVFQRCLIHGHHYLVPRDDGRVLVGSTTENVGFDKRTTAVVIADLVGFAVRLVPYLEKAHVEQTWAGLRPGTKDGLPYIGRVPDSENVWVAAGHYRAGIEFSIGTALLLTEALWGKQTSLSLFPFRLNR